MSCQGLSPDDCAALTAANTTNLSSYLNAPDNPPEPIDTGVLPDNLKAKIQECNGNDNCKLIGYDFIANVGEKASSSPYLIQLDSTSGNVDKTDVAVLAKIGDNPVTSLGIPTQNLTSQYKSDHLQLTPPITSGPIGYSYLGEGTALSEIGTSSFRGTSVDACATECSTRDCQGFNFNESATNCTLFPLVEKEATIGTATLLQSNKGTTLTLNLKDSLTGLAAGQIVDGLSSYINGDVTIRTVTSSTQIQVGFSEQIALAIPINTPFRIKTPMTVSTLQAYASDQAHINFIGVNGNETYGYNAKFKITGIPGLPTVTNGAVLVSGTTRTNFSYPLGSPPNFTEQSKAIPNAANLIQPVKPELVVPVDLSQITGNPYITGGVLGNGCSTGLFQNEVASRTTYFTVFGQDQNGQSIGSEIKDQTRSECEQQCNNTNACNGYVSYTSYNADLRASCWLIKYFPNPINLNVSIRAMRADPVLTRTVSCVPPVDPTGFVCSESCKSGMYIVSKTTSSVTFQIPENSTLPTQLPTGTPITLNAIEFTATLAAGSAAPSERIIGWTGSITQTGGGSAIPVVVKSYTPTTITFTFPAQSYATINAQDVVLSDTKGRSCQDIKACNASVQRLLDTSGISSFSTKDLVACSGCNERAYKKPISGTINLVKLREYLWFENAGAYACTGNPPPGTTLDETCTPVCTTTTANGDTTYDSVTQACRVTCRPGFYWNGTTCVTCPSITLPTNITVQSAPLCKAMCVHATGTTPTNMTIGTTNSGSDIPAIPNYTTACTVSCSSGFPNPTNTRCCPVVTTPTGTTITGYTDDCATPVCAKTDGTNDFIDTVTGSSGPTCSYTCQSVTTNNGTTFSPITSDTYQTGLVLPAKGSASSFATLMSADPELVGTGDVQTNIGTYVFTPLGSRAAIYTGTGTPTQYTLPIDGIISINFPFKIKIESIEFWKSTATRVNINLKNVQGGTDILSQDHSLTTLRFSSSQSAFGRFLTMTFSGGGTVAYKITATIQKICTGVCNPPANLTNGRVVLDSTRACKIICNQNYTPSGTACSSCLVVAPDPGTNYTFNPADCGGSCYVYNPLVGNNANLLPNADAYAGTTNTNLATFAAGDTGTTRMCHIKACPSGRTMYTDSGNTTLNNSGCCPIPTIPPNSGITWSYPANGTTVGSPCVLTCTAPSTYGMTTVPTQPTSTLQTSSCSRVCPTYSNPTGFTISVNSDTCQPICALATSDDGGSVSTTGYGSGITCTKMCNQNYDKDSAMSKCCPTWTGGTNITITYGTSICSQTPCSVTDNTSGYAIIGHNASNKTCSITCKNRGTDQTGTTGSYSADSKCTFSCSQPSQTTYPNGTGNRASDVSGNPYCAFGCSGSNYKSLGASKCCANITPDTGTRANKRNDATCDFDCVLSDTTTYPAARYTSTAVGRTCVLGCVNPTLASGTVLDTSPTVAGGCNDFTCKLASDKSDTTYKAIKSGQGCTLGCVDPTTDNLSTVGTVNADCTFTCNSKIANGVSDPATDGTRACKWRSCASGYDNINTGTATSWWPVCCQPVSTPAGTKRYWTYDTNTGYPTCNFTCSLAAGYSTVNSWAKPAADGSRACVLATPTYTTWSAWSACNAECCGWQKRTRTQTEGHAVGTVETSTPQRCNTDANSCLVRFYSGCNHDGNKSGTLLPNWAYDMPWGVTYINRPGYGPSTRSGSTVTQALDSPMTLPPNQVISTYMGVRNDDLLSLKIPSGVKVTVYQNNNFGGLWFTMSGNDPATKNRKFCNTDKWWADGGGRTSSVKVEFDTPAI